MRLILLCLGLFFSMSLFGQFGYSPSNLIIDGAGANDLAPIDLDNDGDLDLLVLKEIGHFNAAYWYENVDGQGNFAIPQHFDHFVNWYDGHLEIADLNGDGLDDIVGGTVWLENTGAVDGFIEHKYGTSYAGYVYPTDMDNDGDIDLLLTPVIERGQGSQGNIYWQENIDGNGNFVFSEPFGLLANNDTYTAMNVLDFDADGDKDVVAGYKEKNSGLTYIRIYSNTDGTGNNMQVFQDIPIGGYIVHEFAVGDREGDGYEEFATIEEFPQPSFNQYEAYVYFNSFGFGPWIRYADQSLFPSQVEALDLFGIGGSDLVVITPQVDNLHLNWWEAPSPLYTASSGDLFSESVGTFGDFNADGQLDFIEYAKIKESKAASPAANLYYNDNILDFGNSNPEFSYHLQQPESGKILDWDNSGSNDILILEGTDFNQNLVWFSNDGAGNFSEKNVLIDHAGSVRQMLPFDINNDGNLDVILSKNSAKVEAYLRNADGDLIETDNAFLESSINHLMVGDLDGDQLEDYLFFSNTTDALSWKINNQDISGAVSEIDASISESILAIDIEDLNGDGANDIYIAFSSGNQYAYYNNGNGTFGEKSLLTSVPDPNTYLGIEDINKDGFPDIILSASSLLNPSSEKIVISYYDAGSNAYLDPVDVLDETSIREIQLVDIDQDGDLDIYTNIGLAINISGFGDFFMNRVSGGNTNYNYILDVTQDLDGDSAPDKVRLVYGAMSWQSNQYDEQAVLSGKIIIDANNNCEEDSTEFLLPNTLVRIEHDGVEQYANSSLQGYYGTVTPELGDYTLEVIPSSPYWTPCEVDTVLEVYDTNQDYVVDFHLQAEVDCPLLSPNISVGFLRPCLPGFIVLNFCNYGTVDSEISQAEIYLPPGLAVDSVNYPIFAETDSSLIFELDPVHPGFCEGIYIYVTPDCSQLGVGSVVCPSVHVTPDDLCAPINMNWDGSTIEVTGTCVGDSAIFEIQNIGAGSMDEARQFRASIINDDIIMLVIDTFQLGTQEIKTIKFLNTADHAMRLEADQDIDHPIANVAGALVQNCLGLFDELWTTLLQSFPQFNGDPFTDIDCQTITGSFDPNEKVAMPTGFGEEHHIQRNWDLDYTIHFQNTGNDTAFLVEVIDTLSPLLDISTLRVTNSSHPFTWNLGPANDLIFTFENILLPDSFVNVLGSQGFIEYSIQPKTDAPFNTPINNRAAIYFDFNDPIITNTVFHTIQKPIVYGSVHQAICPGDEYLNEIYFSDTTLQELFEYAEYDSIAFHHLDVMDSYLVNIDTALMSGTIYQEVIIESDTTLLLELLASNGCDSLVQSNISVIINSDAQQWWDQSIQVFPVPTKDQVRLTWDNISVNQIALYNATGKLILVQEDLESGMPLELENYPAGVYHLQFSGDDGKCIKRLIKL